MFQRLFSAFGARISKRANSQQSDPAGRLTVEYESDSDAYGTEHAPSLPSDFDQSQESSDIDPNDVSLPQTSLSSELSTNGLRGGLRLIRPRAYNPQCIVLVVADYLPREDGSYFLPKSIYTVNKVHDRFAKYGPIVYTIGHEAMQSRSREYYIVFENATSAATVHAETREGEAPARCSRLRLIRSATIPLSFGDWVARFCDAQTKLPDDCAHLSCTHPRKARDNLFLRRATCTPNIVPIPRSNHPSRHESHDQSLYVAQPNSPIEMADEALMGGLALQHTPYSTTHSPDFQASNIQDTGMSQSQSAMWQAFDPLQPTLQPTLDTLISFPVVFYPAPNSIPSASPQAAINLPTLYGSPNASSPLPQYLAPEVAVTVGLSPCPLWKDASSDEESLEQTPNTSPSSHNPLKRALEDDSETPETSLTKRLKQ